MHLININKNKLFSVCATYRSVFYRELNQKIFLFLFISKSKMSLYFPDKLLASD